MFFSFSCPVLCGQVCYVLDRCRGGETHKQVSYAQVQAANGVDFAQHKLFSAIYVHVK